MILEMGRLFLEFNLSRFITEELAVLVSQTLSLSSDFWEICSAIGGGSGGSLFRWLLDLDYNVAPRSANAKHQPSLEIHKESYLTGVSSFWVHCFKFDRRHVQFVDSVELDQWFIGSSSHFNFIEFVDLFISLITALFIFSLEGYGEKLKDLRRLSGAGTFVSKKGALGPIVTSGAEQKLGFLFLSKSNARTISLSSATSVISSGWKCSVTYLGNICLSSCLRLGLALDDF
ncbi:hypothetical protein Tco_0490081 [Tanacetum coccineum]